MKETGLKCCLLLSSPSSLWWPPQKSLQRSPLLLTDHSLNTKKGEQSDHLQIMISLPLFLLYVYFLFCHTMVIQ